VGSADCEVCAWAWWGSLGPSRAPLVMLRARGAELWCGLLRRCPGLVDLQGLQHQLRGRKIPVRVATPPPGQAGACSGCQPLRRCACRAGCAVDQPGVCTSCQGQGQSFPCMACMQPADVVEGIALGCCSMPSRALSSRLWGPERRPGTHHHRHRITSHPITHHHTASHPITNALRGLTRWPSALQCSVSRAAHASRDNAAKIAAGLTPVSARSVDAAMPALAQNDTRLPPLPSRGLLVVQACAAGTVQPSVAFVTACTPCPEGQSQPQPQQTSCTVCGINTYQDQPGQSSCLGCASCLPGTILVGCGGASNGTCTACGS
jgi:hypothetical protein